MVSFGSSLIGFIIAWVISAIVVYVTSKLFGETEGFGTAIIAALVGAIIYFVMGLLLPGIIGSLLALVGWLLALKYFYHAGWIKSALMAIVIWILATIVGLLLPTLPGPF
jgi:biotin transporter BioY